MSVYGKWSIILLLHPTHIQNQEPQADSGPRQVQMSGGVRITYIPNRRTQNWSDNLIQGTGMVFLANG